MNPQLEKLFERIKNEYYGAARFRWIGMVAVWFICLAGWAAVLYLPDVYEANARVFVNAGTSLEPVLEGLAINQDFGAQVNYVRQALLGGAQLERVAREAGLDKHAADSQSLAELLDEIQKNTRIDGVDSNGGTVYTINYRSSDREIGIQVVGILMRTFVDETLGGKRTDAQAAQSFATGEIQQYEQRLRSSEERLADFKRKNVGQMPGAQGDYFSRLQTEMQEEEKLRSKLGIAVTRRDELKRQLLGESSSAKESAIESEIGKEVAADLAEARAQLNELLLRYTDKHPEVIAARETVKQLEKRRDDEIGALRRGERSPAAGGTINAVIQRIQVAFNEAEVEVAALRNELADRARNVAQLRQLVDTVPKVEAEFARLNRDYDVTRTQYSALVERLEKVNLGERADSTESDRFKVIDLPSAEFKPVAPKRPALMAAVLVLALGMGGALAYMLNQIKPVFHSSRMLSEHFRLPVLGVVSAVWRDRHRKHIFHELAWFAAGIAGLGVAFVVVLQFQVAGTLFIQRLVS